MNQINDLEESSFDETLEISNDHALSTVNSLEDYGVHSSTQDIPPLSIGSISGSISLNSMSFSSGFSYLSQDGECDSTPDLSLNSYRFIDSDNSARRLQMTPMSLDSHIQRLSEEKFECRSRFHSEHGRCLAPIDDIQLHYFIPSEREESSEMSPKGELDESYVHAVFPYFCDTNKNSYLDSHYSTSDSTSSHFDSDLAHIGIDISPEDNPSFTSRVHDSTSYEPIPTSALLLSQYSSDIHSKSSSQPHRLRQTTSVGECSSSSDSMSSSHSSVIHQVPLCTSNKDSIQGSQVQRSPSPNCTGLEDIHRHLRTPSSEILPRQGDSEYTVCSDAVLFSPSPPKPHPLPLSGGSFGSVVHIHDHSDSSRSSSPPTECSLMIVGSNGDAYLSHGNENDSILSCDEEFLIVPKNRFNEPRA
ncbi:hypothetical protein ADUPG1_012974 [Aduncisulcus paluster]|uniref:Uncharacterized protein n=1 Tax=Aduncisulcus paluster TaxID=2918883 RepID=A0ABQ5K4Z8_9EUKA|nr:hypothetical protein ADUPG1_012974 [Aduncisulcus paluster]|eukprot:gnl/Carplike_NY0171/49_a70_4686.p1 GENE.gnl/Carplike_NY0171/49_a70_4686~~gnl/Carplike_NY0171/49_a70_4686.p1  ORF type:complete len:417 (-),score=69.48 gnl/Carplike_NY0171/49_a70_4686:1147-2397(-)